MMAQKIQNGRDKVRTGKRRRGIYVDVVNIKCDSEKEIEKKNLFIYLFFFFYVYTVWNEKTKYEK